jgi:hypothetical protein
VSNHPASAEALRAWAKGLYTSEAATELLLRAFGGRFATDAQPWIHRDDDWWWIEWDAIPPNLAGLSGGERRLLLIAASIGGNAPVNVGDLITGIDRPTVALVLAALSHAAGTQEHTEYMPTVLDDGQRVIDPTSPRLDLGPLYPWPDQETSR